MHAWAEIEHKLAYESNSQVPKEFKRKLSRISAKLKESDEQFEEIRLLVENNKEQLVEATKRSNGFDLDAEFNLDNLQVFLDYSFPGRERNLKDTSNLFEEMIEKLITLKDLVKGYNESIQYLSEVEEKVAEFYGQPAEPVWVQIEAARTIMELTNDSYFEEMDKYSETEAIRRVREKIKKWV